ncbi:homologous recombination OB-fold protein, partial [Ascaphus truei]|uniref:homologous recombination OB-fold protein n=1 Tax=Ascaphus truei TaxID=8439 RepID=UPI003F5A3F5F
VQVTELSLLSSPVGEIQGTVHHLLLEEREREFKAGSVLLLQEREREFKAGSVLLLQKVGVFSPSHRNHYLNVTPQQLGEDLPPEEGWVEGEEGRSAGIRVSQTSRCAETDVNSNLTRSAPRPSPNTQEPGAWDMDDLDSFLCDLPEDTSCCEQDPAPLPTASPPHRLIPRGGGDNYTLTPPISDTSGPARDWPSRS